MYISVNDASEKFNISKRRVQLLCEQGRINGANMVNGIWLIPESTQKPADARKKHIDENQINLFDTSEKVFTIDDICNMLSISKATVKNWIRLNKIIPDIENQLFSQKYIDSFISELNSGNNKKLKSRRNKKNMKGKALYKDYVHTVSNQNLVEELLELNIVQNEDDLLIVLANFAVQLYYQKHKIQYSNNNVLLDFLSSSHIDDFYILIYDLLKKQAVNTTSIDKLQPALTKKVLFVSGEDTLGFIYISLRDISHRKSTGAYYTPENIVDSLIKSLYNNDGELKSKTVCDPCCGTGNFLLRLGAKGIDYSNIYAQDIDPISVYLSRINIALMAPQISASELYSRIIIGNSYFETFDKQFDIILGNPPWGSDFSHEDELKCRKIFKTANKKSIESYDLFVEKALSMLKHNGILAFVLPEAILSVSSHDAVRRLLLDSCSFKFVSYLGNVFSGVQCPAVILGVSLDDYKTTIGCKVSTSNRNFTIATQRTFGDGTLSLNVSDEENDCLGAISNIGNSVYLKENAKFALGIVTGNNKEYISDRNQNGYEIILKGSNIRRYGISSPESYIKFVPESFQQVAPTEIYRAKEKLLYRFICQAPVFTYDNKQTLSLNSCNIVIPEIPGLDMKYILAILNSSITAYFISKKFNSVKLLRSHIEQIPIPAVSKEIQSAIIKKVDRIMNSHENISGLYEDLDNDIMKIFNLDDNQIDTIKLALAGKNLFLG